ncbi:MAG: (d)CMP kinase [Christensenellaceae bacterium]
MLNIAIDGPSGSGKSTVARYLAGKLNILYLDTGAMYRACALKALKLGITDYTEEKVKPFIDNINIEIKYENGAQVTLLDGVDVSGEIRKNEVSMMASDISALKCVRLKMVDMQRSIAAKMDCILDGRDIGTCVLPDAEFKFYITASPFVRAKRRHLELIERGETVDFEKLVKEIETRDYNDSHREFSPLKKADDAILIDTSDMTIEEVIRCVTDIIGSEK